MELSKNWKKSRKYEHGRGFLNGDKRVSLRGMVKAIDKLNRHKEVDWGKPVGKEIFKL